MTKTLDAFVDAARAACGPDLVGIVLYGSAAGRDYHGAGSDENVMVLVRRADASVLGALAPAVHRWTSAGNPPPLLLSVAEWQRRSDVFALEYADLLEQHRLVYGALPLEGVRVRRGDLRTQLESEIMGKLLRFRRGVMNAGGNPRHTRALLDESLSALLTLLRGLLHLHGEPAPSSSEALCDRAAELAGFSPAPFRALVAQRRGTSIHDDALAGVVAGSLEALERALAHVDGYTVND